MDEQLVIMIVAPIKGKYTFILWKRLLVWNEKILAYKGTAGI